MKREPHLHDGFQIRWPGLLSFGHSVDVDFACICWILMQKQISQEHYCARFKVVSQTHLPTIPLTGLTAASRALKTSTTALSFRMFFCRTVRKFCKEETRTDHYYYYYVFMVFIVLIINHECFDTITDVQFFTKSCYLLEIWHFDAIQFDLILLLQLIIDFIY